MKRIRNNRNNTLELTLLTKYKIIRNQVTSKIRKESVEHNNKRVIDARNVNKVWKIVNSTIFDN